MTATFNEAMKADEWHSLPLAVVALQWQYYLNRMTEDSRHSSLSQKGSLRVAAGSRRLPVAVSEAEYPSQTPDWKPRTRKWYKHDKLRIYLLGD